MKDICVWFDFKAESYRVSWEQKVALQPHKDPAATKCMRKATTSCAFQIEALIWFQTRAQPADKTKLGKKQVKEKSTLGHHF